ncbi:MAG: hypothetical protein IZT58_00700 [Actinobacteria bacterium]|nr:hypothetical protein [Actinomycetota bacterium]
MEIGYDPNRIRTLSRQTTASIHSLGALRSSDQAAADALRAAKLMRRNLEELWMPLLREIEHSDAMVSWLRTALEAIRASGARTAQWLTLDDAGKADKHVADNAQPRAVFSELSDTEMLSWLEFAGNDTFPWLDHDGQSSSALRGFSEDLAVRVNADDSFAERLLTLAPSTQLIALATGEATFPAAFTRDVIIAMLGSVPWFSGLDALADAHGVQVAMSALLDDPAKCLDVLADTEALFALARWPLLDTTTLQEFTTAGLYEAVRIDVGRLGDGYEVLSELTRLANGPLDGGMQAGIARGVAIAMTGYIDTLAPAVRHEGSNPVLVIDEEYNVEIDLGTYDEVVDLFGAIMRDAPAQAALGTALGSYTYTVVDELGENITRHLGLDRVTRFADLLGDAARAEQAELVMAAAAAEAFREQLGGAARFGIDAGLTASGVGLIARGLASRATKIAVDWAAQVDPGEMPDHSIPSQTYDLITVAAVALVTEKPSLRASLRLGKIDDDSWDEVDEQLTAIEKSANPRERQRNISILNRYIEDELPALGGYMREVRNIEGLDELTEGRNAVGED